MKLFVSRQRTLMIGTALSVTLVVKCSSVANAGVFIIRVVVHHRPVKLSPARLAWFVLLASINDCNHVTVIYRLKIQSPYCPLKKTAGHCSIN